MADDNNDDLTHPPMDAPWYYEHGKPRFPNADPRAYNANDLLAYAKDRPIADSFEAMLPWLSGLGALLTGRGRPGMAVRDDAMALMLNPRMGRSITGGRPERYRDYRYDGPEAENSSAGLYGTGKIGTAADKGFATRYRDDGTVVPNAPEVPPRAANDPFPDYTKVVKADGGRIGEGLTDPSSLEPLPYDDAYRYSTSPDAPSGEIKGLDPRPADFGVGDEAGAARLGKYAREGDWMSALGEAGNLVLGAVPAVGARRGRRGRIQPQKSLDQFVDELNARPSALGKDYYDRYHQRKADYIPESVLWKPSGEPVTQRAEPPPEVAKLREALGQNDSHMRKLIDQGMYSGPGGRPVNPWYWPTWTDAFTDRLGPEIGMDMAHKWAGYNAGTSMQTAVPRNQLEAFMLYHHDLNDIPFDRLSNAELTGKAFNTKLKYAGDIAEGRGLMGKDGPKVRSYWQNLMGSGTEPDFVLTSSGYKPTDLPTTLDSIMSREMGYQYDEGHPSEGKAKRLRGPAYAEGVNYINNAARDIGAATADTQAAPWQRSQWLKHEDPIYFDPFTRILDDNILKIAKQEGIAPEKVLDELVEGRRMPPNFWYPETLGKAEGGAVDEMAYPDLFKSALYPETPAWNALDRESTNATVDTAKHDWPLAESARTLWANTIWPPAGSVAQENDGSILPIPHPDQMRAGRDGGGRIGEGMTDPDSLEPLPRDFDPSIWMPPSDEPVAPRGELKAPSRPGDPMTGQVANEAAAARLGQALKSGDWREGLVSGAELMANSAPAMFIGPAGARRLNRKGWGSPEALKEAEQQWGKKDRGDIWRDYGWTPHDTWGTDRNAPYKGEPATWHPAPELAVDESGFHRFVHNDAVGKRRDDVLPPMLTGATDLYQAEPSIMKMTGRFSIDPNSRFATGSTGWRPLYEGNVKRLGSNPTGAIANSMELHGNSMDELNTLLPHEMQHAIGLGQKLAPTAATAQMMSPIMGTKAEQILRDRVAELERRYQAAQALSEPGRPHPEAIRLFEQLLAARGQLDRAPGYAGYLNSPEERLAREAFIRHTRIPEDQQINYVPGDIDTYAPGTMGERLEATHSVPMRAYDPRVPSVTTGRDDDRAKGSTGQAVGASAEAGGLSQRGGLPRGDSWLSVSGGHDDPYTPIPGQPRTVDIPGHGEIEARPLPGIEVARRDYLQRRGLPNREPESMPAFDEQRARRIAQAYEEMKHDPTNPEVRRAYDAMIEETLAQMDALERQGYRFKFNKPGEDPYAALPALGYLDVRDKGELSVFPTLEGFGSGVKLTPEEVANNPLLTDVGRKWGDSPITANDAFRAVHDMFGHFGPGNPYFRHKGEERAWGHHSLMYPPSARGAMTSETRGQNSWLNFGPHGEHNRDASGADTVYADQKTGLMPDWTWIEGVPVTIEKKADGGDVKAQFGLDQRFPADLTGPWQSQYQPPSTGELKALPERPSDWSQPIAEQLSPTMGAYGATQLGMDAYHDWKEGDYPELGYKAPLVAGMFIGPRGARRLQKAGYLHPDDPGGTNRWQGAKQRLKQGDDPSEVWKQDRWAAPDAFGPSAQNAPYAGRPVSWMGIPDLRVNEDAFTPIKMGQSTPTPYDYHQASGRLPDLFMGLEGKALAAFPELDKLSAHLVVDPTKPYAEGATSFGGKFRNGIDSEQGISQIWPSYMQASAPSFPELNRVSRHELGHAFAVPERLTPSDITVSQMGPDAPRLSGTKAEDHAREQVERLSQHVDTVAAQYGPDSPEYGFILNRFLRAKKRLDEVPMHAAYLHAPDERLARATDIVYHEYDPNMPMSWSPHDIDTYKEGAMGADYQKMYGFPLHFMDPKRKAEGGSVELAGYDAPYSQEASTRSSYSDYDLGNARQGIDEDYQDWRQRALDERYDQDLDTAEVLRAMHAIARYRLGRHPSRHTEDRRTDKDTFAEHDQTLAETANDVPSYAWNYGPLPGPREPSSAERRFAPGGFVFDEPEDDDYAGDSESADTSAIERAGAILHNQPNTTWRPHLDIAYEDRSRTPSYDPTEIAEYMSDVLSRGQTPYDFDDFASGGAVKGWWR